MNSDFACGSASYMMNRQPHFVKDVDFHNDRFHGFSHKCGTTYDVSDKPWKAIGNTSLAEQSNSVVSVLKKLAHLSTFEHTMFAMQKLTAERFVHPITLSLSLSLGLARITLPLSPYSHPFDWHLDLPRTHMPCTQKRRESGVPDQQGGDLCKRLFVGNDRVPPETNGGLTRRSTFVGSAASRCDSGLQGPRRHGRPRPGVLGISHCAAATEYEGCYRHAEIGCRTGPNFGESSPSRDLLSRQRCAGGRGPGVCAVSLGGGGRRCRLPVEHSKVILAWRRL